jgi:hypothetical protein
LLKGDYPAIIFANGSGHSNMDHANIGSVLLQKGAVGFVGPTLMALGAPGWIRPDHGSGQSMDYYFNTFLTMGDRTLGEAHQEALRTLYQKGYWRYNRYETFLWGALLGNPNLMLYRAPVEEVPLAESIDPASF